MTLDIAGIKQGQRAMWSAGDYPEIAQRIQSAADAVVDLAVCRRTTTCSTSRPAAATSRSSAPGAAPT